MVEGIISNVRVGQIARGRADRGDVRAVGHGHRNRLVGAVAGRPLCGVEGYTEGHGTPAGADFRYLLEQLGANPAGWRCAFASPNAWNDRVPGMVMHKLLLIPLVPLSPIKPEGENPQ